MTLSEKRLWERLRARRLDGIHFRRQQVIRGFVVDFYCHAAGPAIEVDGDSHRFQKGFDQAREESLNEIGVRVIRFQNEDILMRIDKVLARIGEACRAKRSDDGNLDENFTRPPGPPSQREGGISISRNSPPRIGEGRRGEVALGRDRFLLECHAVNLFQVHLHAQSRSGRDVNRAI